MRIIGNRGWPAALFGLALGCGEASSTTDAKTCSGSEGALDGDGLGLTALALGPASACGVANDGTLLCWGTPGTHTPEPVPDMGSVTTVAISWVDTCAIRPGGSVICWNEFEPEPEVVPDLCGATALTVSVDARCAAIDDGSVRCWGGLNESVFGKSSSRRAVAVPGVSGAVNVAAGASGYTCALIADGSVTCWGGGPRGGGRPGIQPAPVPEISGAVALAGLGEDTPDMCAVLVDGTATCWTHAFAPAPVPSLENVVSLARGLSHACAALGDGTVRCWGRNMNGQLGNGTMEDSDSPVVVEGLSGATEVVVGSLDSSIGRSCALLEDGSARCWGSNFRGQLGDGSLLDSSTPVEVKLP